MTREQLDEMKKRTGFISFNPVYDYSPMVQDIFALIKYVEELRKVVEYIELANPYPDLSLHKYRDAFRILEKKADKVLGKEEKSMVE